MEKTIRLKLRENPELVASFGLLIYQAIPRDPGRIYALDYLRSLAPVLGFDPNDLDEAEEPLISGNLEDPEGTYLVFENITTEELMGLAGGEIGDCYDQLNEEDKQRFDLALQGDGDDCRTEELNSWTGPSLHI